MTWEVVLAVVTVFLIWSINRLLNVGSREPNLPPGPPTVPILGNLHIFPKEFAHIKFTEWAKVYGEIYSLKMGSMTAIVLSSPRVVRELLDIRSASTSDRPSSHFVDITTDGLNLGLAHYGTEWKLLRRIAHDILTREACKNHLPIQQAEATQLMYDLLKDPQAFYTHMYRYPASVILSVVFGLRCPRFEGSIVQEFIEVERLWTETLEPAGGRLPPIDFLPILRYVPERWATWKRLSREIRQSQRNIFFGLAELCRLRMKEERRNDCFMEYVIDHQQEYSLTNEMIGYIGGVLMEGGSDTTSLFLQSFIFCLVAYPEVQTRAQKDIDEVIGCNRSPQLADFDNLPYVDAIIKEVHRFRPVPPTGVPHASISDEVVDGYTIPKGSIIFMNIWGIFHDSESFEQPDVFNPDRFLKSEYGTKEGVNTTGRRHDMVFGGGRRICPGIQLANNSIILNAMNLLWAFNFSPGKDPITGHPIPIDLNAMNEGILSGPKPFKCEIVARSRAHADIICSDFAEAEPIFNRFEQELSKDEVLRK